MMISAPRRAGLECKNKFGLVMTIWLAVMFAFFVQATDRVFAETGQPAREAVLPSQTADTLSIVDLATNKVSVNISIGGAPVGIALSPDRRFAYITSPESKEFLVFDLDARVVIKDVPVGPSPVGIAVNPATGVIYVTVYEAEIEYGVIVAFDGKTLRRQAEVKVGNAPSGVAVSKDGQFIVSTDRDSNQISIIDAASFKVTQTISVGEHPFGLAISSDGKRVYTANVKSNDVTIVDLASGQVVDTVRVGRRPYAIAVVNNRAFVSDQYGGTVTVFDEQTLKVEKTIEVGAFPEGIAADPVAGKVYVACWEENTLERIDAKTLEVEVKIPVADGPRALGDFLR